MSSIGLIDFIGWLVNHAYPNVFFLSLILVAFATYFLLKIQAPTSVTVMSVLALFLVINGGSILGSTLLGISSNFLPIVIIVFVIFAGGLALALWKLLGS
jgi:hypothetical protein